LLYIIAGRIIEEESLPGIKPIHLEALKIQGDENYLETLADLAKRSVSY
jgi:hypothetical protein